MLLSVMDEILCKRIAFNVVKPLSISAKLAQGRPSFSYERI